MKTRKGRSVFDHEAWAFFGIIATGVFGYLTSKLKVRSDIEAKQGDSVRQDMKFIVDNLRADVESLKSENREIRENFENIERRLDESEDNLRWAMGDLRRILTYLKERYGDEGPGLSVPVRRLLRRQHG